MTGVTTCQADGKQVAGLAISGMAINRLNDSVADFGAGGMHGPDAPSYCGASNRAMTGVRVALRQVGGERAITGLQASCARLEVKN